jgi:hypothetical protein
MIRHLAEGVNREVVARGRFAQEVLPNMVIARVMVDGAATSPSRSDVVYGTRKLDAKWACHFTNLGERWEMTLIHL